MYVPTPLTYGTVDSRGRTSALPATTPRAAGVLLNINAHRPAPSAVSPALRASIRATAPARSYTAPAQIIEYPHPPLWRRAPAASRSVRASPRHERCLACPPAHYPPAAAPSSSLPRARRAPTRPAPSPRFTYMHAPLPHTHNNFELTARRSIRRARRPTLLRVHFHALSYPHSHQLSKEPNTPPLPHPPPHPPRQAHPIPGAPRPIVIARESPSIIVANHPVYLSIYLAAWLHRTRPSCLAYAAHSAIRVQWVIRSGPAMIRVQRTPIPIPITPPPRPLSAASRTPQHAPRAVRRARRSGRPVIRAEGGMSRCSVYNIPPPPRAKPVHHRHRRPPERESPAAYLSTYLRISLPGYTPHARSSCLAYVVYSDKYAAAGDTRPMGDTQRSNDDTRPTDDTRAHTDAHTYPRSPTHPPRQARPHRAPTASPSRLNANHLYLSSESPSVIVSISVPGYTPRAVVVSRVRHAQRYAAVQRVIRARTQTPTAHEVRRGRRSGPGQARAGRAHTEVIRAEDITIHAHLHIASAKSHLSLLASERVPVPGPGYIPPILPTPSDYPRRREQRTRKRAPIAPPGGPRVYGYVSPSAV
ncbi:hypothetical protein HYPSUDRAFT_207257 [Hypholoma sublateritium FD-334 SS-4]|uniref:Uncharacterized protein n=1 Tax=Hypholoma sublateritium (strain FD-334 SS-4) TaxID=945553 RepID=A0A0D2KNP2_HYPSF|nr:hypothetical protein HYPSUDRAFT_207257 [Hypholoma sublateritium FD-334 SS-4]